MHAAIDLHVRGLLEDKLPVPQSSICRVRRYTCITKRSPQLSLTSPKTPAPTSRNRSCKQSITEKATVYADVYPTLVALNRKLQSVNEITQIHVLQTDFLISTQ